MNVLGEIMAGTPVNELNFNTTKALDIYEKFLTATLEKDDNVSKSVDKDLSMDIVRYFDACATAPVGMCNGHTYAARVINLRDAQHAKEIVDDLHNSGKTALLMYVFKSRPGPLILRYAEVPA